MSCDSEEMKMFESEEERKGKGRQLKEKIRMINIEKEREDRGR